jgi:glutamyl-tRNA synthetase
LHLGHARTFWTAQQRARDAGGVLVFRNEDLDRERCRPQFVAAMYEDLRWFGLDWQEGPDVAAQPNGGPFAPYTQSERHKYYLRAWERLRDSGAIYPCTCSRKDLAQSASAPHEDQDEPLYPGTCRNRNIDGVEFDDPAGVTKARTRCCCADQSSSVESLELRLLACLHRQRYTVGAPGFSGVIAHVSCGL